MRFWIDDTELESDTDVGTPDVFVFGGLALTNEQEDALRAQIRAVKTKYAKSSAYQDMPIKWNFKDVKEAYQFDAEAQNVYEKLRQSSKDWRSEVFEAIAKSDARLFVCPVEAFSVKKEVIQQTKSQLARFGFVNVLQRFAMYAKYYKLGQARIVVDWPTGGDRAPIEGEYQAAYRRGRATDGNSYTAGTLANIGFEDAPMFSITQQSAMLQAADLVVGASRFFLNATLQKKEYGLGLAYLKQVRGNFHGGADNAHRYSFQPSGTETFCRVVKDALRHDLYEVPRP